MSTTEAGIKLVVHSRNYKVIPIPYEPLSGRWHWSPSWNRLMGWGRRRNRVNDRRSQISLFTARGQWHHAIRVGQGAIVVKDGGGQGRQAGGETFILDLLNHNLLFDAIINYLSAECNRLWNIAMDMLPGVFPGRLLNICRDCWESWEGWTFVVVVVVVGDTDPPAVNLAPLPSSFSSLAEESSTNDRSRLSGRPKRQRKRVRWEFTWI